ncbi:hypothetical protein L218DRAFT_638656 [Marasmius fiardii PR-910]|nr:hypothetical protein L218DRAFT_638656 [Marasmius fiardii PR-910]
MHTTGISIPFQVERKSSSGRHHSKTAEPKKRSASISDSETDHGDKHRPSKRRSRRSRSGPRVSDDSDVSGRRRRKKSKRKHKKDKHNDRKNDDVEEKEKPDSVPPRETEEEYDARLEREEKERLDAARRRELERVKSRYESEPQPMKGIRYKGRGRMKYIDPDASR